MNTCPLCESDKNELLYTNSRGNKYLENYVCCNCGFVYTWPRISNQEVERLYSDGDFSKEARKSSVPDLAKFKQTEQYALERIHHLETKIPDFFSKVHSCVEIGCGAGSFLWLLKSRGQKVLGIEPDVDYVQVVKKRYKIPIETVMFQDYDNTELFDFICNFHVIEHIINPRAFVKEIYNRLKDEGFLYIECPTIDNIYTGSLDTFFWDVHVNTFSNNTLPWLLESEGFSIKEIFMNRGFVSIIAKKGTQVKFKSDDKDRIIGIVKSFAPKPKKISFSKRIETKIKNVIKSVLE
ncbi:methyltransferase family protein [Winogradskyella wandonensis]|uniref:Methyltransferase family protein n=1 Tax=Winogradskyella wandonensis TaxID=1442586 RepID=A0A4V2PU24_9FLAO|nr:class I SAM-dependent methyltransferase [Winogradskyella wandonensis]TCK68811.1 methyltransferase family protein [Winogradskyella wandonensis]